MATANGVPAATIVPIGPAKLADKKWKPKKPLHERMAVYEKLPTRLFMSKKELAREKYQDMDNDALTEEYERLAATGMSSFDILSAVHEVAPVEKPHDASRPLLTLLRLSGTGLELALGRPDFWLLLTFHVVLSVVYYGGGGGVKFDINANGTPTERGWPKISAAIVGIPGSLISLSIVFFLSQTYARYVQQYTRIMLTFGYLGELQTMLRVHMGDHVSANARVVCHQLCKTLIALYIFVFANIPHNRTFRVDNWAWWYCVKFKILTKTQVEEMKPVVPMGNGNPLYNEFGMWFIRGIWAQQSRGTIDDETALLFMDRLYKVRQNMDGMFHFPSGTVPFAYYQLLNFITTIYLFLLSYTFVFSATYWSIPVFFLILASLLGARELGNSMCNPLGADKMDISAFHEVKQFIEASTFLINHDVSYADEAPEMAPIKAPDIPKQEQANYGAPHLKDLLIGHHHSFK